MIRLINLCSFRRSSILPVLIVSFAFSYQAKGQFFWHVDAANCPDQGVGSIVDPYCSIQTAIDASFDGDTIEVAPGTYYEAINFIGKAITLHSTDGAESTIIDATDVPDLSSNVSVVRCVSGEMAATVLDGFTITGGTGSQAVIGRSGGGGMHNYGSNPTITNCLFRENSAINGGGMYNLFSNPTVTNCTFVNNAAPSQASSGGGMYNVESSPTLTNCMFISNTAPDGGGMHNYIANPKLTNCKFVGNMRGGGMSNRWANPTLTKCIFSENAERFGSGGGGMQNILSSPTLIECTFNENTTDASGGGMHNTASSNATVTNCTFSRNTAHNFNGGGMYNENSAPIVTRSIFSGNSAQTGGGISNYVDNATIINCTFVDNAAYLDGGGIYYDTFGPGPYLPILTNSKFLGNKAGRHGGGVYVGTRYYPKLTNCLFVGNTANRGGGLISAPASSPTLTNCTFSGNTANFGGGIDFHGIKLTLTNCILWGDSPDELLNITTIMPTIAHSNIEGSGGSAAWNPSLGIDMGGNIDADPHFVRYSDPGPDGQWDGVDDNYGDLRLSNGSPSIDAADNTAVPIDVTVDLNGNPRFVDDPFIDDTGLGISPIVDMGAYEFQPLKVAIDIKPGSCPNPVNRRSRGVLPVAIVGSGDFDVSEIDLDSLMLSRADGVGDSAMPLHGSKGPGIVIEDVSSPFMEEVCDCHDLGSDGVDDLLLKFSTPVLVNVLQLDTLERNETIELILNGSLLDGTEFVGVDCIKIKGKARSWDRIRNLKKDR